MKFGKESPRHAMPGMPQDARLEKTLRAWAAVSNTLALCISFFLLYRLWAAPLPRVFSFGLTAAVAVLLSSNTALFWLASVIQKRRREEERKASFDPLTDVLNRNAFEKILDEELRRSGRYHYPVSVCLIDLDHFRSYNQSFGSVQGDEFLRKFGAFLSANIRFSDCVARFESDTFAALLPHTDVVRAQRFLARIQAGCEEQLDCSFSAGVTAYQSGESREELTRRTLVALAHAKKEGGKHIRSLIPGQDAQTILTF